MTYVIYGAVGVIAVLLLLICGAFLGWKARIAWEKHNTKVIHEELTEEKRRQFLADQEAFEAMINYSPDTAYGLTPNTLENLAKKE